MWCHRNNLLCKNESLTHAAQSQTFNLHRFFKNETNSSEDSGVYCKSIYYNSIFIHCSYSVDFNETDILILSPSGIIYLFFELKSIIQFLVPMKFDLDNVLLYLNYPTPTQHNATPFPTNSPTHPNHGHIPNFKWSSLIRHTLQNLFLWIMMMMNWFVLGAPNAWSLLLSPYWCTKVGE